LISSFGAVSFVVTLPVPKLLSTGEESGSNVYCPLAARIRFLPCFLGIGEDTGSGFAIYVVASGCSFLCFGEKFGSIVEVS
jgi:hypothetical protein